MSLVQYSDSESDADQPASPPAKKPRYEAKAPTTGSLVLPPLPPAFHDLYASSTRVSVKDDPSLHGGRKRVIPHVEGNWPTHVYVEWYPAKNELALLAELIARAQCPVDLSDDIDSDVAGSASTPRLHSLLHSDLGAQLPLHISLSAPVVLRTEQRASFTEALTKGIRDSHIPPFTVTPDALKWVSNYERTRWFLVLHVARPVSDGLNRLLALSNRALAVFDQPALYASSSSRDARRNRALGAHDRGLGPTGSGDYSDCFHVSLAWSLTEPGKVEEERVAGLELGDVQSMRVRFDSVKVKIGNHVESVALPVDV
ncbi:uncharacterized protein N7473_012494 [Penicillium subrubescens]|uniref:uncharacterized protein n=1 Tax=Penicillium subrubescens TaxID=1316194 RepID=UPI0025456835|nr:uncharacterized protein N7473_012494 [Penicillium subrubescens]KAJ5875147.1 hypothetical protein N7473_012494 [Penicillium subrubescens]